VTAVTHPGVTKVTPDPVTPVTDQKAGGADDPGTTEVREGEGGETTVAEKQPKKVTPKAPEEKAAKTRKPATRVTKQLKSLKTVRSVRSVRSALQ
jgi:hypothetical protein